SRPCSTRGRCSKTSTCASAASSLRSTSRASGYFRSPPTSSGCRRRRCAAGRRLPLASTTAWRRRPCDDASPHPRPLSRSAGPTCTRLLADLGAEVIKIEGLKRMDITRNFVMPENDSADDYWNRGGYFLLRNGGKKSLTLDFSESSGGAGIEIVKKLALLCD